jgi:hypothetical protein
MTQRIKGGTKGGWPLAVAALLALPTSGVLASTVVVNATTTISSGGSTANDYDIQSGGTLVLETNLNFSFAGGTWTGTVRPESASTLQNASLSTLNINPAVLGNGFAEGTPAAAGGTFQNLGTVNFQGTGNFTLNSDSTFKNSSAASRTASGDLTFQASSNNAIETGFFVNEGSFTHAGNGDIRFKSVTGSGTVNFKQTAAGSLVINSDGRFILDEAVNTTDRALNGTITIVDGSMFVAGAEFAADDSADVNSRSVASFSAGTTLANVTIYTKVLRGDDLTIATATTISAGNDVLETSSSAITLAGGTLKGSSLSSNGGDAPAIAGFGTIDANVIANGDLTPHGNTVNDIGTLTIDGTLDVASAFIFLDIIPSFNQSTNADRISVTNGLTLNLDNGGFNVVSSSNSGWAAGMTFNLLDGGPLDIFGDLSNISLPDLNDPNLTWNLSSLATTGTISVVAIPEPTVAIAATILGLTFGLRRVRL